MPPSDQGGTVMELGQVTTTYSTTSGMSAGLLFVYFIAIYILTALPFYLIFKKAGRDDAWAAFVPIYNFYVLLKVIGRPGWWLVLLIIPIVNFIILIIVYYDLSRSFGHGVGFTIGLIFLSIIFLFILGLGSSTYRGPAAAVGGSTPPPAPPMPTG
jgi:hypothetical protein